MEVQNIWHFSLLKDFLADTCGFCCCFVFMAPGITEEPEAIPLQTVCAGGEDLIRSCFKIELVSLLPCTAASTRAAQPH